MELITDRPIHPFCAMVPPPSEEQFQALALDIVERQEILEPVRIYKGQILAGRCRAAIAKMHNIFLPEMEFEGTELDALRFVQSTDLMRRHMTPSDRANLATWLLQEIEKRKIDNSEILEPGLRNSSIPQPKAPNATGKNKGGQTPEERRKKDRERKANSAAAKVAKEVGSSVSSVAIVKKLQTEAPDLAAKVDSKEITMHAAAKELKARKSKPESDAAKKPEISKDTLTDQNGDEVPESLREAFESVKQSKALCRIIDGLIRDVEKWCDGPGGAYAAISKIRTDLTNAKGYLKSVTPYAVCSRCAGAKCGECKQRGFVTRRMHENLAESAA